jgi:DNA-binding transcriptional LysR family regulator
VRAFVAVVEDGGLSAAVRRLHVSQSALSQAMQPLERQLGARLPTRSRPGVRPTPAGQALAREARSLIEHHDRALAAVTSLAGNAASVTAGQLRIGVPLTAPPPMGSRRHKVLGDAPGDYIHG